MLGELLLDRANGRVYIRFEFYHGRSKSHTMTIALR